jgi:hypothetical protein
VDRLGCRGFEREVLDRDAAEIGAAEPFARVEDLDADNVAVGVDIDRHPVLDVDVVVGMGLSDLDLQRVRFRIVLDLHNRSLLHGAVRLNTAEITTTRSVSSRHVTRTNRSETCFHRFVRPAPEDSSQSGVSSAAWTRSSPIRCQRIRFRACHVIRTGFTERVERVYRQLRPIGTADQG